MIQTVAALVFWVASSGLLIIIVNELLRRSGRRDWIFPQQQQRYPTEIQVSQTDADKARWVCEEGVKRLANWRGIKEIQIRFCIPETMPQRGQVLGCVFFEIPNTMFINSAYINQSWLVAKGVLHELYHIYQIDTLGSTNDTDDSVNSWSDKILDEILFEKFYKSTGKTRRVALFNMKFPTIKTDKYIGVKCEKHI